ncbi:MAG: NAD(+) synthase [Chloroflexi bacterium]|nr:NAD(+) synthase [Chloroflexota bacterium]
MDEAFLDVRSHGYVRVAVCVPDGRVADVAYNTAAHIDVLRQAHAAGARLAVCPELGLTGYTAGDLFFQDTLQRAAIDALATIAAATRDWDMAVCVGMPIAAGGSLFNCAVTLYGGHPVAVAPKAYPPNYREFYELRWFRMAAEATVDEVTLLGETVPFGTVLLVEIEGQPGFVLHTDICEDIWVPVSPGTLAALAGATVLANLSASNITVSKWEYRLDLVRGSAAKNLAVQLYSAAGFGESTADLAWDGHGIIADRGDVIAQTPRFRTGGSLAIADADLLALQSDRMRQTSWGQNAAAFAQPVRRIIVPPVEDRRPRAVFERLERQVEPFPYAPADPAKLDARCEEIFQIMSTSLARRLTALPEKGRHLVLGLSGGRDSTLALLVAVRALDQLGLPRSRMIAVTMPGFGTSERTRSIATSLAHALGVTLREIPVSRIAEEVFSAIGHDAEVEDLTFENVQAWSRKFLLFSVAGKEGGIDLGTSDLSELALGFTTYGGDHMSHYGVNAGVPKTLVSRLIRWTADTVFAGDAAVSRALGDVLETPISPELLRPSASGEIVQISEDVVGPYELHDFFLYSFTRFGFGPRRIARMALHAFDGKYSLAEIKRWLIVFLARFFAAQYKRDAIPDAPKVGSGGSLSPRGDWRMPSDASPAAWLAEAESIPAD